MEKKMITIRIEADLWDHMVKLCKAEDTTASREVRKMIREWVRKHAQARLV